jgi:hypothetical protein
MHVCKTVQTLGVREQQKLGSQTRNTRLVYVLTYIRRRTSLRAHGFHRHRCSPGRGSYDSAKIFFRTRLFLESISPNVRALSPWYSTRGGAPFASSVQYFSRDVRSPQ